MLKEFGLQIRIITIIRIANPSLDGAVHEINNPICVRKQIGAIVWNNVVGKDSDIIRTCYHPYDFFRIAQHKRNIILK